MNPKCAVSFELFPPSASRGWARLKETVKTLRTCDPSYFSVTFGAGGSARQSQSITLINYLIQAGVIVTPHITCINTTRQIVDDLLHAYRELGINRLIVVRGDLTEERTQFVDFLYASDLIYYIRKQYGETFKISIAAYPEFHPESRTLQEEWVNLKKKVDLGVESAITQYFFNPDAYYQYVEHCRKIGIQIPIIPGIMPIHDYDKLKKFSEKCRAEIPVWLDKRLQAYHNQPQSLLQLGIDVVTQLCESLLAYGAPSLHFYTLNQCEVISSILSNLKHPCLFETCASAFNHEAAVIKRRALNESESSY